LNSPIVTHIRSNILLQKIKATQILPIHKIWTKNGAINAPF
jgi:hypothetical protein